MSPSSTGLLPRTPPESPGIPHAAINAFLDGVDDAGLDLHSLMVLRHGTVVAEAYWAPFGAADAHMMFSLSKSFTATAIGLAVAEGLLSVDDRVVDLLPDDAPAEISDKLAALRVRHLLTMTTGHDVDVFSDLGNAESPTWASRILANPLVHEPGTHYLYNTGGSYLLSVIVQRLTGLRLLDYLTPRLFEPLGIVDATWEQSPQGIDIGGIGLSTTTEAIALLGQLYLQRGQWNGRQILSEEWVAEATSAQVSNGDATLELDWVQGYGYQFWRCRHGAYRGDGAFGQFCIVLPEQDAVVVMTAGVQDMQRQIDLVWQHLLPALASDSDGLDDATERAALAARLDALTLAFPPGALASGTSLAVSKQRFRLGENPLGITAIGLTTDGQNRLLDLSFGADTYRIALGHEQWLPGEAPSPEGGVAPIVAAGAWTDKTVYTARIWYLNTPFRIDITMTFGKDSLDVSVEQNVSFGPTDLGRLSGSLIDDDHHEG